jgi:hypothetical protein
MKIRILAIAGLAIGFVMQTFAQEQRMARTLFHSAASRNLFEDF